LSVVIAECCYDVIFAMSIDCCGMVKGGSDL